MRNSRSRLDKIIAVGLLVAVAFTALAHGAVEPWSVFVFEIIIVALLLLWAVKIVVEKRFSISLPRTALPVAALTVVGLAQSVAFADGSGRWRSLSMNVGFTRAAVTVLIFLLISFVIAANFLGTRERLAGLSHFLCIYGLAMALFALIQHFAWNGSFYWLRHTEATTPFGPFANHNHFAGYMELLIALPVALIITRAVRPELRVLYGFAAMMMGVAAVSSLSRGGIISLAAAMMFLIFMGVRLPRGGAGADAKRGFARIATQAAVVAGIVAVISVGILWIGADPVINRVTQGEKSESAPKETFFSSRGWVWRDTAAMIGANPVLGVGLGAYETAFSIYTKSDGSLRVPQAHNDYLQVMADCGLVGALIALWFLIIAFKAVSRGARSRDPLFAGLALGSGAGMFAILVHSLFDFNLQLPSNALLFLLLSAVATYAAAGVSDSEGLATMSRSRGILKPDTVSVSLPAS